MQKDILCKEFCIQLFIILVILLYSYYMNNLQWKNGTLNLYIFVITQLSTTGYYLFQVTIFIHFCICYVPQ